MADDHESERPDLHEGGPVKSFLEHLEDFRWVMVKSVVALFLAMINTAALAHAYLQTADPPVGGTLAAPPTEIRINFSEGVEPAFSGLTLATSDGASVPVGKPAVDPQNKLLWRMNQRRLEAEQKARVVKLHDNNPPSSQCLVPAGKLPPQGRCWVVVQSWKPLPQVG